MSDTQLAERHEGALTIDPMISMIERVALDPNADLAKLERMLELKERHDDRQAKAAFAAAFALASAGFPVIPKNGRGHNQSAFATLEGYHKADTSRFVGARLGAVLLD